VATSLPSSATAGPTAPATDSAWATLPSSGVSGPRGSFARSGRSEPPRLTPPRRTRLPFLTLGLLLVIGGALAFYVGSLRASDRVPVLVLARDVGAGQPLVRADVRVAQVAAGGDVATVPAGELPSVVGRTLAVPRSEGALLSPDDMGKSKFPPRGQAVAAVALKPGQFPPGLAAGARVSALVTPGRLPSATVSGSGGGNGGAAGTKAPRSTWLPGVVVAVAPDDAAGGGAVVSLLMDENAASAVSAAAEGTVSVIELSPDGGQADG
jgi:hypothetical protein